MLTAVGASASAQAPPGALPPQPPPDKEACVAAFDRGQRAQSDRSLRRAQSELIVCAQESCPTVLRADCAGVLAEVRTALPTLVFAADDGNGHELTDVKVFVGSELVAPALDGRAVAVDPGTFELRFERPGQAPVLTTRTIREGEKSRVIRVSLPIGSEHDGDHGGSARSPRRDTLGWLLPGSLAAAGVAGLGVALYTRLDFDGRVDELRGSCAPDCTQEQRSDLSGTLVTSNVALGIGLGALALAAVSWFVTAPASSQPSTTRPRATSRAAPHAFVPGGFTW